MRCPAHFLLLLMLLLAMIACGSNSNMSNTMSGSGSSGSGSSTGSSGSGSNGSGSSTSGPFTESMLSSNTNAVAGQVAIAQNGTGTVTIHAAMPNTTYGIEFCPFASLGSACNSLGTAISSASGAISANFMMSSGSYSGIFQLLNGSSVAYLSDFSLPANGSTLQASIIRASTVTAGFPSLTSVGYGVGFDSLTSGSVTLGSASTIQVTMKGTPANTGYILTWCPNNAGSGSSCMTVGNVMTDMQGNFTGSFDLSMTLGASSMESGVFYMADNKPPVITFVEGFTVP